MQKKLRITNFAVGEYGILDNNQVFTMDDLGNRTKVNEHDGNDVTYSVDNLTNRYNSVGPNSLAYDKAGDLIHDKDDYNYQYDYENRIVKITRDPNDTVVAEFAYDALGRRIEKKDLIDPNNTRRYYYNNDWQVLCEYDGSNNFICWYAYGNYIDEVLLTSPGSGSTFFPPGTQCYIHDHLYSPVAPMFCYPFRQVYERYEYDAYGEPAIHTGKGNDGIRLRRTSAAEGRREGKAS